MSRSKGSTSSATAKEIAQQIEAILGTKYKYNFDMLRLVELLICYRIVQELDKIDKSGIEDDESCGRSVTVEIPLIGNLTITSSEFHSRHGITNSPSTHFEFEFKPSSGFKTDVAKAFNDKDSGIGDTLATIYSDRLTELYEKFRKG